MAETNVFSRSVKIFPSECRQRAATYRGRLSVTLKWKIDGQHAGAQSKMVGQVPIMVKVNLIYFTPVPFCCMAVGYLINRIYRAPSLESRFCEKLLELLYPLHGLELRSQKWIISTYICLLQCGEGFSENLRILCLPQGTWFEKLLKVLKSTS